MATVEEVSTSTGPVNTPKSIYTSPVSMNHPPNSWAQSMTTDMQNHSYTSPVSMGSPTHSQNYPNHLTDPGISEMGHQIGHQMNEVHQSGVNEFRHYPLQHQDQTYIPGYQWNTQVIGGSLKANSNSTGFTR